MIQMKKISHTLIDSPFNYLQYYYIAIKINFNCIIFDIICLKRIYNFIFQYNSILPLDIVNEDY